MDDEESAVLVEFRVYNEEYQKTEIISVTLKKPTS